MSISLTRCAHGPRRAPRGDRLRHSRRACATRPRGRPSLPPETSRQGRIELGAATRQRRLDLWLGRFVGQPDQQRPPPDGSCRPEDGVSGCEERVEVGNPIGRPAESFQRTDAGDDPAPFQRESKGIGRRVEAGHPRCEDLRTGRAIAVDHDEPARRKVKKANACGGAVFVRLIRRVLELNGQRGGLARRSRRLARGVTKKRVSGGWSSPSVW